MSHNIPVPIISNMHKCAYCGGIHSGTCPRVKAIEYDSKTGAVTRVEFHDGARVDAIGKEVPTP